MLETDKLSDMLGLCQNGHLTGYLICPLCGTDRNPKLFTGAGRVDGPLVRDEHGDHWLLKLRRETRNQSNCRIGPNLGAGLLPPL